MAVEFRALPLALWAPGRPGIALHPNFDFGFPNHQVVQLKLIRIQQQLTEFTDLHSSVLPQLRWAFTYIGDEPILHRC